MTNIYGYKKEIEKLKDNRKIFEEKDEKKYKRAIEKINNEIKIRRFKIKKIREERLRKAKKGSLGMGFLFAFFFFMIGMWMLPFMKDGATDARTNIQCTNASISDGAKVTCILVGGGVPYFIVVVLTFAGGFIGREL